MDLIGSFFSSLGVWGVIGHTAAILFLLLALFLIFKPKSRSVRRAQNSELSNPAAPDKKPWIDGDQWDSTNKPPISREEIPPLILPSPAPQAPEGDAISATKKMDRRRLANPSEQIEEAQKESKETAEETPDSAPMKEQDILDQAMEQASQNPDKPSGFGASGKMKPSVAAPSAPAPATEALAEEADELFEEDAFETAVPYTASPGLPEPDSTPAKPDLTEMESRLLKKLESQSNSPLSTPEPSLSLPETADAGEADDVAAAFAKPSGAVNAADEPRPENPAAAIPVLINDQLLKGVSHQTLELSPIEQLESTIDTIEKKMEEILGKPADQEKTAVITDQVSCSVFAPSKAPPQEQLMVQVFLHVDADLIKVHELAKEADEEVEKRLGFAQLKTPIVRGAMVDIALEGHGLEVDEKLQSLIWQGSPQSANFIVTMPEGTKAKNYFPIARLYIDGIPIGHIKFKLSAIPEQATEPVGLISPNDDTRSSLQGIEQRTYKRAFISYSRKNFELVSHFNEGLIHGGFETFFDLESLEAGERWTNAITKAIDASDVFFLCWTTEAKSSQWVDKEILYAITQQSRSSLEQPTIVPISFETPLPTPPHFLSHLHFNSRHQLIRAGMKTAKMES